MLKFDGVDIGLFEKRSHLWPSREFANAKRSGGELKKKTADLGLRVSDVFLLMADFKAFATNHPNASRRRKARDWFLKTLDYGNACGCDHVTIVPGVENDGELRDVSYARALEELRWRVERATRQRIVLGVEPHIGSIVSDPVSSARLVADVPGLTLTLDYTHFTREGLSDSAIEPLLRHASHFHFRGAGPGRVQASLKNNTIDYARVVRLLRKAGYRGWYGVEYVWIDWEHSNECDNLSETILMRDFLRSLKRRV